MPSPTVRHVFVALICCGLVLAGCDGSVPDAARSSHPPPTSAAPPTTAAPTTSTSRAPSGPYVGRSYAVGVHTETYVDPSRPTSAVGSYPGASSRTFTTTIWYPAVGAPGGAPVTDAPPMLADAPFPLILFAHGYAVTASAYASMVAGWAASGYVVAGPTYPLLSGVPAGPSHADYEEAFTDSSFVIDRVVEQSGRPGNPLSGLVDRTRIGAAGHSDGEIIAFGLAYLACCRDTRVRSVAAFAGNLENVGANQLVHGIGVPVLHATGERDEFDAYGPSIAWDRTYLEPPRWITTLRNASHSPPFFDAQSPWFSVVSRATIAFFDGTLKDSPARLDAVAAEIAMHPDLASLER